jgi:alkyl sulfatase BDS1-like metallo-beta-lactamase superfamily hydrolase
MSGHQAKTPDLTLTLPRALLLPVLAGVMPLDKLVADGKAKLDGKGALLTQTLGLMVRHTPNFEILPGTKPAAR